MFTKTTKYITVGKMAKWNAFAMLSILFSFQNVSAQTTGTKPTTPAEKSIIVTKPRSVGSGAGANDQTAEINCATLKFPSINYNVQKSIIVTKPRAGVGGNTTLTAEASSSLNRTSDILKANPDCKIKVSGHGAATKAAQQLSWDRVNAVVRYLVDKTGISPRRIVFEYGTEGDPQMVDLRGTSEEGPSNVPAPHPDLRQ